MQLAAGALLEVEGKSVWREMFRQRRYKLVYTAEVNLWAVSDRAA